MMTQEQAIALADSKWWEDTSAHGIVMFQLFEERLCMPFGEFHRAVEAALGRPVWTHEFGSYGAAGLKKEFLGEKTAPTFEDILAILPEKARVIFAVAK